MTLSVEQKKIIAYSLNFPISEIKTFVGYKGDNVIKITTMDPKAVDSIEVFAKSLMIQDVNVKANTIHQFEIYCIIKNDHKYDLALKRQ